MDKRHEHIVVAAQEGNELRDILDREEAQGFSLVGLTSHKDTLVAVLRRTVVGEDRPSGTLGEVPAGDN